MSAAARSSSSSGAATVTHASSGSSGGAAVPHASAVTRSGAHSTTRGVVTFARAAKAATGGVGAWCPGHALAGVHPIGSIGPYLVRPVVISRTAAIVYRRASIDRAARGVADLRGGHTRSYQRRS
jgi:hypothetical protein